MNYHQLKAGGLHFQFSLRGWFPIGRPLLGTERVRLVDVARTRVSRGLEVAMRYLTAACSRLKGLRHTTPPVAKYLQSRALIFQNVEEQFKPSQFLPCMNAGVSLGDLDEITKCVGKIEEALLTN